MFGSMIDVLCRHLSSIKVLNRLWTDRSEFKGSTSDHIPRENFNLNTYLYKKANKSFLFCVSQWCTRFRMCTSKKQDINMEWTMRYTCRPHWWFMMTVLKIATQSRTRTDKLDGFTVGKWATFAKNFAINTVILRIDFATPRGYGLL